MKRTFSLLLALLALQTQAALPQAEQLVREGHYTQALKELDADLPQGTPTDAPNGEAEESPAASYWRGRALCGLERYTEAAISFSRIPDTDREFYPYAAKGIMLCAWKSNYLNFVEAVAPLTISKNEEIAALATAAMAEFQLRHSQGGDTASLNELRRLAKKNEAMQPILRLLEIEDLRLQRKYDEAIAAVREIESDASLSHVTHHRARLALAEVYYSREADSALRGAPPPPEEEEAAYGLGEETLLQFISSNPESPVLQEAFRRLVIHRAFITSQFTINRLNDWSNDTSHPMRAALALLMQQRAISAGFSHIDRNVMANTAVSIGQEKAARTVILETVRELVAEGKTDQALTLLSTLPPDASPQIPFFRAACMPPDSKEAARTYFESAELAYGGLQPAAASNALYCAFKSGDTELLQKLLDERQPQHARRALLLTYAALLQQEQPQKALEVLDSMASLSLTPKDKAEIVLIRCGITLKDDPSGALATLLELPAGTTDTWTDGQILRYYQLQLEAVDKLTQGDQQRAIDHLKQLLSETTRPLVAYELTCNLAERLSSTRQSKEALHLLEELAEKAENPQGKARALLRAAEESAKLGSLDALNKSIDLFEQCTRIPSPYRDRAEIHRARVLMWVNRIPEALHTLKTQLEQAENMSSSDVALCYTALADAYALDGTEESKSAALQTSQAALELPGLSEDWRIRIRLQHAAFCARYDLHEQALTDYLQLLQANPDTCPQLTKAQWFILHYAGSGAVYEHAQLKQYEEAANLAEKLSGWFKPVTEGPHAHESEDFVSWAKSIRYLEYR